MQWGRASIPLPGFSQHRADNRRPTSVRWRSCSRRKSASTQPSSPTASAARSCRLRTGRRRRGSLNLIVGRVGRGRCSRTANGQPAARPQAELMRQRAGGRPRDVERLPLQLPAATAELERPEVRRPTREQLDLAEHGCDASLTPTPGLADTNRGHSAAMEQVPDFASDRPEAAPRVNVRRPACLRRCCGPSGPTRWSLVEMGGQMRPQ